MQEAKLCEVLGGGLEVPDLRTVVQCCAYVLGVAGHRGTPGDALAAELRARCGPSHCDRISRSPPSLVGLFSFLSPLRDDDITFWSSVTMAR